MKLFDVYPLMPVNIVKAENCKLWDENGTEYLDFYGGHAVISVGHTHPHYVEKIQNQLGQIGFYSNSVINKLQEELAEKLGKISGYEDYSLFLCNSGAEANENALKIASFTSGKKKFITLRNSFHGRTSAVVAATDDPSIVAPVNETDNFIFCEWNNVERFTKLFFENLQDLAGVIIEGIQGIGGIQIPTQELMDKISELCCENNVFFISDEIQSGYARSGKFFAHQHFGVKPDIITTAKGMANGFPIGGVLVSPKIPAKHKMLGTTFGGNHLACAAAIAVLEIIEKENLIQESFEKGEYLIQKLKEISQIKEIRGKGLLIGIDFEIPASQVSKKLREEFKIFVGSATNPLTMRLLPPLTISYPEMDYFISSLKSVLNSI
ncbi:aminotransferase class III-fold pyridoxal phosphate-dependent enzyme [Kaistella sp. DKR-2]|uniref:aspartate aminotransferase family protein n=1 Tax=Kaistella soli TaxID=2849654 RepID=UPI001C272A82|nr:aminotransferase class III-fold pyridoxal phosphate-dependent enzyme [Kaistella soli]MBU8881805.1 aminotransferase class III-fold pyridoxal phosphate-dependent enzyme [Kaistella soli]